MRWTSYALLGAAASIGHVLAMPAGHTSTSSASPSHTHAPHTEDHDKYDVIDGRYTIHESCNATETRQLRHALAEMIDLAENAKQHVVRYGRRSPHYQKYFGNHPTGEVIGWLERAVYGHPTRALFRCDNPDGNCRMPTWGGHWRGKNATDETVICPRSYETRRHLEEMCAFGYNVAEWELNTYFASDLLHRVYHLPVVGEGWAEHFAETYEEILELARTNSSFAVHDSDALNYFATEVYAYEVAVPGVGCLGPSPHSNSTATHSSTMPVTTSAAAAYGGASTPVSTSSRSVTMASSLTAAPVNSSPTSSAAAVRVAFS
ncbi:MAG: hypothetical protein M1823_004967 [Watsoniomyces obsoletus]|nr:MAG: hypothetical protein M1823_004967 [Watsoniomyces obsoletus]